MPAKKKRSNPTNVVGAAYGRAIRNSGPKVRTSGTAVRVSNKEFFANMSSSDVSGQRTKGILNFQPHTSSLWLGTIAKGYTYYRVHKLKFHYVPAAATDINGYIELGFFYDNEDANAWYEGSGSGLSQNKHYLTAPPWGGASNNMDGGQCLTVDVSNPHLPWFRCDTGGTDYAQASLNLIGTLAVSVVSSEVNYLCGRVFVEYDVEFREPVMAVHNA